MTNGLVMTVADELLAEIEALAVGVKGWNMTHAFQEPEEGFLPEDWEWHVGQIDEDDNRYPLLNVNAHQYDSSDSEKLARYYAACNRDTILSMAVELRRLRAENAELQRIERNRDMWKAQCEQQAISLTEANAVYIAAIKLVSNIRFASGDNGLRMQPELIDFIAELAKDAGRYRHIVHRLWPDGTQTGVSMPRDYSTATKLECDEGIDVAMTSK